jgi:SAM-dependent methyltransferase
MPRAEAASHRAPHTAGLEAARAAARAASLVPGTAEHRLVGLRGPVAVVGNATPQRDYGAIIDRFPSVIRLNNFRVSGYEALVGSRTSLWCTTGWLDIEPRPGWTAISPFRADAAESLHVAGFNARNGAAVIHAITDARRYIEGPAKPSTGLALAQLLSLLGLHADLFAFDGFQTPHYWSPDTSMPTTHATGELAALAALDGLTIHGGDDAAARRDAGPDPGMWHLPAAYVARSVPEYYDDVDGGVVWQPDVYRLVADLARAHGARRVVDVGCGRGRKVAALHPEFDLIGIDFGTNLQHCRAAYPFGQWLEADLERDDALALKTADLQDAVIVAADVIEHLVHPERLLARLRAMLTQASLAVLTTPERRLTHGADHLGPPPNPAHVREWSLEELRALATAAGLDVVFAGLTASESATYAAKTSLLVLAGRDRDTASRQQLAAQTAALLADYAREHRPAAGVVASSDGAGPAADSTDQVSIVMRTKDRPRLLERAIASVVAQSWPAWQLLVVNDAGDPHAVHAAVRAAAGDDSRVTVIHRTEAVGMEAATNAGLAAATGRYISLLDDDDTWEPAFLATCVAHLRRLGSGVRGVVTHSTRVVERLAGARVEEVERTPFTPSLAAVSLAQLTQRNLFPVNAFVYHRDALDTVGPYRADLPVLGDWEFNLRFLRQFDVAVVPEALANVHVRPESPAGAGANSPPAQHLAYDARIRNELLRADLEAGRLGLGLLASLRPLLVDHAEVTRHVDALAREREHLAAQAAAQWTAIHEPLVAGTVARLRRRRAGSVVLVGAGRLAELVMARLEDGGIRCLALGDNDARKWGSGCGKVAVTAVDDAVGVTADAVVVTSIAHGRPIAAQVRALARRHGHRCAIVCVGA